MSLQQEKQRICRYVQIKIYETLQQQPADRGHRCAMEGTGEVALLGRIATFRFPEQNPKESESAQPAEKSSLGQQLHVIVMDVIDELAVIQSLITRINSDKSTQAGAREWMVLKDVRCAHEHRFAAMQSHVSGLQLRESFDRSASSQPCHESQSRKRDNRQSGETRTSRSLARSRQQGEDRDFESKADNAAAGTRKN